MTRHRLITLLLLAALLTAAVPNAAHADRTGAAIAPLDRVEQVETDLWERLLSWLGRSLDQLLSGYTAAEGASMGTHG